MVFLLVCLAVLVDQAEWTLVLITMWDNPHMSFTAVVDDGKFSINTYLNEYGMEVHEPLH